MLLLILLLGMELYLYMIFRGPDVSTAAHHSQFANATGKSKLIETEDAYDPVHSHLWAYRRTGENIKVSPGAKKKKQVGGMEHTAVV